jgi:phospholipid/cholesterol/gamma-HCH transport system substrate-binding protein
METKASYIATGAFTIAVIFGVFGFIYWVQTGGAGSDRAAYRVVFGGSVSGLHPGSSVLFDGMRVGEVTQLALDTHDPRKVDAFIAVDRGVPIRADTKVALDFQGLTGLAEVSLAGGAADAKPLADADGGGPPTLYVDRNASADVTQAARDVLSRIDGLVADNEEAMRSSLRNVESLTATLAQNSKRRDHVMSGLEHLTGDNDNRGEIAEAASAIRKLSDNLDKRTDEISTGLVRFSNSGLREYEAFAVDGRKTLAELQKVIKSINEHPSQLIFGH